MPEDARAPLEVLLLAGRPLNEPVARYGPFVMNTEAEIYQAIRDYQNDRMGEIKAA
ncbi:MAG TPA: pirin-like C-terminal cupin domain-containing protein [Myxococcales bacterium]|nr:pirin-like C-terminal cupin domain-containing protein [Myxococcales bacterium]